MYKWRENSLFNKWCLDNWITTFNKVKLEHSLAAYTKINLKLTKDLNIIHILYFKNPLDILMSCVSFTFVNSEIKWTHQLYEKKKKKTLKITTIAFWGDNWDLKSLWYTGNLGWSWEKQSLMLKIGRRRNTSNYSLQLMIEEIREPSEQSPCNVVVHCKSEIREMASWLK